MRIGVVIIGAKARRTSAVPQRGKRQLDKSLLVRNLFGGGGGRAVIVLPGGKIHMIARSFAALPALLLIAAPARAQTDAQVDQAHRTLGRVLMGGSGVNIFSRDGRVIEGTTVTSVRQTGRCTTVIAETRGMMTELPERYRGEAITTDNDWSDRQFNAAGGVRAEGNRIVYDTRRTNGQPITLWYRVGSYGEASAGAQAMRTLIAACQNGAKDEDLGVDNVVIDDRGSIAALAIDRRNGERYGWAVDYSTREAADRRALQECSRTGGSCQIVLRFTGGCGAYAVDRSRGSTAWGWGTAGDRGGAEGRAAAEARKRGGTNIATRVWGCNSVRGPSASEQAATARAATNAKEQADVEALNASRAAQAKAQAERWAREKADYQRAKEAADAARRKYEADKAAHDAAMAAARAAEAEYQRKMEEYRRELESGKYRRPQ